LSKSEKQQYRKQCSYIHFLGWEIIPQEERRNISTEEEYSLLVFK
jgi:hypothetical protein